MGGRGHSLLQVDYTGAAPHECEPFLSLNYNYKKRVGISLVVVRKWARKTVI